MVLDLVLCLWKIDEIMIIKMAGNVIREIQPKYDFICQTLIGCDWEDMTGVYLLDVTMLCV